MHHQSIKEADIVVYTANIIGIQRIDHAINRLATVIAIGNQLGDHRVVVHRDFTALIDTAIHTHALTLRLSVPREPANRGHKVTEGILRVNPRLHSPAG